MKLGIIALIKVINIASGIIVQNKFIAVHSVMNKITGALLFVLPLTVEIIELRYSAGVVFVVATLAAIQEGHHIRTVKNESIGKYAGFFIRLEATYTNKDAVTNFMYKMRNENGFKD